MATSSNRGTHSSSPRSVIPSSRKHTRRKGRVSTVTLRVEPLEDRTLPAVSITGSIFHDLNANAQRNSGELGLAAQIAYLDENHNSVFDGIVHTFTGSPSIVSGPLGGFGSAHADLNVTSLPARVTDVNVHLNISKSGGTSVLVGLLSPTGATAGAGANLILLGPGHSFNGTFDDQAAQSYTQVSIPISGTYRPDQLLNSAHAQIYSGNPNGGWGLVFIGDSTGLTLHGWSLEFTVAEPNVRSDADGNYAFHDLAPGTYDVGIVLPPAASQTTPAGNGLQQAEVVSGQVTSNVNFGVRPAADLAGASLRLASVPTDWGQDVTFDYTIQNRGAAAAGPFDVEVRLSADGTITGTALLLTTFRATGLAAFSSTSGRITARLPGSGGSPPVGFSKLEDTYLGLRIDSTSLIVEESEANNANLGAGTDVVALAPASVQSLTGADAAVQQMPSVAVNPNDPNHVVVAYLDRSLTPATGYAGVAVKVSHDGGATWPWQTRSITLPTAYNDGAATPMAAFDADGHVFVSFVAAKFVGTKPALLSPDGAERALGLRSTNSVFVARSNDGGLSWSPAVAVAPNIYTGTATTGTKVPFDITPSMAIDMASGKIYVTWTRFYPAAQYPFAIPSNPNNAGSVIEIASSSDGGATWTLHRLPDGKPPLKDPDFSATNAPEGSGVHTLARVAVGSEGEVYVSMNGAGQYRVFLSTDGGATFLAPTVSSLNAQHGTPFLNSTGAGLIGTPTANFLNVATSFRTLAVRDIVADPIRPGYLYAVEAIRIPTSTNAAQSIDTGEIVFARSTDYGITWQKSFKVLGSSPNLSELTGSQRNSYQPVLNDDNATRFTRFATPVENEVISRQALPHMSIDEHGNLVVMWYDTRRDPLNASLDVYATVSTDGGQTFSPNFRLSDSTFNPDNGKFTAATGATNYYFGDWTGLAVVDGVAYAAWTSTDGRTGNQDISFTRFRIPPVPASLGDRFEPNNTLATALNLGSVSAQRVFPRLSVAGAEEDWFKLTTAAAGELLVALNATSGASGLVLELYDPAGILLATGADLLDASGLLQGRQLVETSLSNQTFFVRIRRSDTTGPAVQYTLTVRGLTADLGARVHGLQSGTLAAGSQAAYALTSPLAGSLELKLTSKAGVVGNLNFQVLSGNGRTVLATGTATGGPGAGEVERISLPVEAGQSVLIVVLGANGSAAGPFDLEFTNLDQFQAAQRGTLFFPTAGSPSSVAVGDVDQDGVPDVVVSTNDGSDGVRVLLGNGDGTFQAARQFQVGPGRSTSAAREINLVDLNDDTFLDVVVSNSRADSVSILLGRGDGTFVPDRRSDASGNPDSLASGDFNRDGKTDLVVLERFSLAGGISKLAILLGRDDGSFRPPQHITTSFVNGAFPVRVADFNGDQVDDLAVFSFNDPRAEIFQGRGDGTFAPSRLVFVGEATFEARAVDIDGDTDIDLVTTGTNIGSVYVTLNDGSGAFAAPLSFAASPPAPGDNTALLGLAVVDFAGTDGVSVADGRLDIVVTARSKTGLGTPQLILLAQQVSGAFGAPRKLADLKNAGRIGVEDLNNDGAADLAVSDIGGVRAVFGRLPVLVGNATAATARDLGTVVHFVDQPHGIVPGFSDAFYKLTVPIDPAPGSGQQVVDFSALFENLEGAGLGMEIRNLTGDLLGAGERVRLLADQGETLIVHIFGVDGGGGVRGTGKYTLVVDVLPQVTQVDPIYLLPTATGAPGGPVTGLVVTFQGDLLDAQTASDAANYTVKWLGGDGVLGTADDRVLDLASAPGSTPVVYNPGANIGVSSGLTHPTAVRQTVTLLFDQPLPVGSYEITFASALHTADLNASESSLLAGSLGGHSLVSTPGGTIQDGAVLRLNNLVAAAGTGDANVYNGGTRLFSQMHGDLGALLDALQRDRGDDPGITAALTQLILSYCVPGWDGKTPYLVIWLDPVSIDLEDPQGSRATYDLQTNQVSNSLAKTFVEVGRNVEILVLAGASGTFNLTVADVQASARGAAILLANGQSQTVALTDAMRSGQREFEFRLPSSETPVPPGVNGPGAPSAPGTPTVATATLSPPTVGGSPLLVTALTTLLANATTGNAPGTAAGGSSSATTSTPALGVGGDQLGFVAVALEAASGWFQSAFGPFGSLASISTDLLGIFGSIMTTALQPLGIQVSNPANMGLVEPFAVVLREFFSEVGTGVTGVPLVRSWLDFLRANTPRLAMPGRPPAAPDSAPAVGGKQGNDQGNDGDQEAKRTGPVVPLEILHNTPLEANALAVAALFASGAYFGVPKPDAKTPARKPPRSRKWWWFR